MLEVAAWQGLIDLQQIDDRLAARERERSGHPEKRAELEQRRAAAEARVGQAKDSLQQVEADQRRAETSLQDSEALLKKLEGQQFQVKSNVAYALLLQEMEQARATISDCETKLLEGMDALESARAFLGGAASEAQSVFEHIESGVRALGERERELDAEIARLRGEREVACGRMDSSLLSRYDKIAVRRRPAVVVLAGEICAGCRVGIPPQKIIEALRGEQLIACNNCQRILIHPQRLALPVPA
jgi:predicted  nucleic acid-binding Zn-ribbon protein